MKKRSITLTLMILMTCMISHLSAQKLEVYETDLNFREVADFRFPVDHPSSACVITVGSGLSNNLATTRVSSWSKTYFASPGYGGFGGISNAENGLMIRANGTTGRINFLTGGTPLSFTRMSIDETGKVGIGTMTPTQRLQVSSGNIYIDQAGDGVILKSANGNCWKLTVLNSGAVNTAAIVCP